MPAVAERKHSPKWDRCVAHVGGRGDVDSPEAVCTSVLGDDAYENGKNAAGDLTEADKCAVEAVIRHATAHSTVGQILRGKESVHASGSEIPFVLDPTRWKTKRSREADPGTKVIGTLVPSKIETGAFEIDVQAMSTGPGNDDDGNYYPDSAIESLVELLEGAPCFMDHPDALDDEIQPERESREIIGYYHGARIVDVAEGKAAVATLRLRNGDSDIMRDARSLLEMASEHARLYPDRPAFPAFSINGDGMKRPGEVNGQPRNIVTRFTTLDSTDMVTFAGARGKAIGELSASLREARRSAPKEGTSMEEKMYQALKAAHKEMDEAKEGEEKMRARAKVDGIMQAIEATMGKGEEGRTTITHDDPPTDQEDPNKKKPSKTDPTESGSGESEESEEAEEGRREAIAKKVTSLRESAKIVEKTNPSLAADLLAQAKGLETRDGHFRKIKERARKEQLRADAAEKALAKRDHKEMAETVLRESRLSPDELSLDEVMVGRDKAEMTSIVEARRKLLESISRRHGLSNVTGITPRTSPIRESGGFNLSNWMRESRLPLGSGN